MKTIVRRLRGALGNALVWGTGWFVAAYGLFTGYAILSSLTPLSWVFSAGALLGAVRIGVVGALTGALFSAYIAANFRHQKLQDISASRFALGAGLVTALPILLISLWGNLTTGWPFFLRDVLEPLLYYGPIGIITGYGSIRLAKYGLPPGRKTTEIEGGGDALLPEA